MKKLHRGLILILMMFGHNYVLNQAQALQEQIQELHSVNVPQFNLLYSIPSAVSIFFIIPLGILYDRYSEIILLLSSFILLIGQLIVTIFGPLVTSHSYQFLIAGRTLEGTGAEVLYMIQGNLASSWMGSFAGITFILPQIGEIANVFITPIVSQKWGIGPALIIGFSTCVISYIACLFLYCHLVKNKKLKQRIKVMTSSPKQSSMDLQKMQKDSDRIIPQSKGNSNNEVIEDVEDIQNKENSVGSNEKNNQKGAKRRQVEDSRNQSNSSLDSQLQSMPTNIMKAGQIFWLMIALCAINQCLYFPFLDNANVLIQRRFCVPHQKTGIYLCLPFISAIVTTAFLGKGVLENNQRHKLIFLASLAPLCGHLVIFLITNCDGQSNLFEEIFLVTGLGLFGVGLGSYYSISFPAVGLAVPESIRGTAYACLCFFQTLSMTAVPLISGYIIEQDKENNDNFILGYQHSSFLFVCLCLLGVLMSFIIMKRANSESFKYDDEHANEQEQDDTDMVSSIDQINTSN